MTDVVQSLITIVLFFVVLGLLVLVHELGHFLTARAAKVRVLEFGSASRRGRRCSVQGKRDPLHAQLAADRRLRQARGRGRRRPRRSALVLEPGLLTRLWILVAGVLMNIILAFVLFSAIAWFASLCRREDRQRGGLAGPGGRAPGRPGRSTRSTARATSSCSARRSWTSTGQRCTTEATHRRHSPSSTPMARSARSRSRSGRGRDAANQGALGVKAAPGGFELPWSGEEARPRSRPVHRRAAPGGRARAYPRRPRHDRDLGWQQIDAAAAGAGPVGIAAARGHLRGAGPILALYIVGHPVGEPRGREHPAVPAAGWRADADDHAQALFGARISLRAEQITYMVEFVFLFAFLILVTDFDIIRQLGGGTCSHSLATPDQLRPTRRPTVTVDVGGVLVGSAHPDRRPVDDQHRHRGRRRHGDPGRPAGPCRLASWCA